MKHTTLMSAAILGIFAAGAMASTTQLTGNNLPAEEKEGCKDKDGCIGDAFPANTSRNSRWLLRTVPWGLAHIPGDWHIFSFARSAGNSTSK
jgi:hypothetical protein